MSKPDDIKADRYQINKILGSIIDDPPEWRSGRAEFSVPWMDEEDSGSWMSGLCSQLPDGWDADWEGFGNTDNEGNCTEYVAIYQMTNSERS